MITEESRRRAPWLETALDLLLAVAFLYPQSLAPDRRIAYVGDSLESVAIVGFVGRQIVRDPTDLFDAGFLHPQPNALTLTDHRLLPSVVVAPILWATENPVLAYNAALLFAFALAAFGARSLARELGLSRVAAACAGALFAFNTYAINEAPRLNIVSHGFVPLALGSLIRYMRTGEHGARRRFALYALLQGYAANYHLLYAALLSCFVLLVFAAADPRGAVRRARGLLLPALSAVILFLPVLVVYAQTFRSLDLSRARPRGIDLLHYFSTSPTNVVWGAIGPPARLQQQGPHFLGFVLLGLVIAALLLHVRRREFRWLPPALALSMVLVVLSLGDRIVIAGHDLGPGPYGLLYDFAPGFRLVRIPERLGLFATLGLALVGSAALHRLAAAGRPRLAVGVGLVAVLEHLSPIPVQTHVPRPGEIPPVYAWLRSQPPAPIVEVPVRGESLVRQETIDMFFATFHGQRQALGYTAYPTLLSRVVRRALMDFPSEGSLATLKRIGVTRVLVHRGRAIAPDLRDQVFNFGPPDAERRFAEAVRLAGLDVEARVDVAIREGRLRREASFGPWSGGDWNLTGTEVVLFDAPLVAAAPLAGGVALPRDVLRLRAKEGDPQAAFDGAHETAYVLPRTLRGDEFLEATFDTPRAVSGVELVLRHESAWPTRFRVATLSENGWVERARFEAPHLLQLVDGLLRDPRSGRVSFALDAVEVRGVQLLPEIGGTSPAGWSLPELRILVRRSR